MPCSGIPRLLYLPLESARAGGESGKMCNPHPRRIRCSVGPWKTL